jgi:deoxyribonucleoside regulator
MQKSKYMRERESDIERCARLYYIEGRAQGETAKALGMSQSQVSRLLKKAREDKVIEFRFRPNYLSKLEGNLIDSFGLRSAIVSLSEQPDDPESQLGLETANFFERVVEEDWSIGISGGRTLARFVQALPYHARSLQIFPLAIWGMLEPHVYSVNPVILGPLMQHKCGPQTRVLRYELPPIYNDEFSKVKKLVGENIQKTRKGLSNADLILTGVGAVTTDNPVFRLAQNSGLSLTRLKQMGVVGNIFSHLINDSGQAIASQIDQMSISLLDFEQLAGLCRKKEKFVVVVAAGQSKLPVIAAALRGKLCNVLITDSNTAQSLLADVLSPSRI